MLLSIALVFSMFGSLAYAADEMTAQEKFDALKEKGIFTGINEAGDAGLDQPMNRAQFARVASLILGLEGIGSTDTLEVTEKPFSDVELSHWAVEEIAAAKEAGLFVGNGDGTFTPDDNITVQQLAVVVTGLLGLDAVEDAEVDGAADWAAPYIQAIINAGVAFPTNYTEDAFRSDLVDAAYVVEAVINPPAVTALDIASVNPVTNTKVEVSLNSAVTAVSAEDYTIKAADSTVLAVTSATLSSDGKKVTLVTAAQTPYILYTLTAANQSFNFVGQEADTAAPKLTSAVATTNVKVKLVFDSELDSATATNITNYTIAGLSVLKADLSGKEVTLTTSAQTMGTIYTVVVANVQDLAGNTIAAADGSFQFGGLAPDTTAPTVTSAVALTNTSVKVTFGEIMNKATAEDVANYTIAGLTVTGAALDSGGLFVTLTTSSQTIGTIYAVVVANVTDDSGNKIGTNSTQFGGLAPDTTAPTVSSAVALTNTSVRVTFNEALDADSAKNAANYTIAGLTVTKAELDSTGKLVTLTTSSQTVGTIYAVVAANVKDASGNAVGTNSTQFGGLAPDTTAPGISSVVSASNTSVTVTFNEAVGTGATSPYNYYLGSELLYPTKVTKVSDTIYTLTTAAQSAKVYTVTINNVKDLSGNAIAANSTANFAGSAGAADTTAPTVASAVATNINTVVVTFSENVTGVDAADFVFSVNSGTETGTAVAGATPAAVSVDGKTVTMQFAAATMTSGVVYKVTVTAGSLTDTASVPNAIGSTGNTALFAGVTIANPAPTVSSAIAVNNQTINITFSEPVTVNLAGLVAGDFVYTNGFAGTFTGTPTLSSDKKTLTVYYSGAGVTTPGQIYTVTVNATKFTDALGLVNLSSTDSGNVGTFAGVSAAVTSPKITSVVAVDANTIDVTFDQKVDQTILGTFVPGADVTITGLAANEVLIRAEGSDGNKLRIFFDNSVPFVAGTIYTLNLNEAKIVNLNGVAMAAADNNKMFAAISTANPAPSVVSAVQKSATTVDVVFSEKVANVAANGSDFTLTGATVTGATYSGNTVTLTFGALLTSGIKTVGIATATITDEAGVATVAINASATSLAYADTTAPTSTIASAAYTEATDTLVITGTNFTTIAAAATDIKGYVDWSKIVFDINGDNATTANVTFAASDITSATITNATTLTIVLTSAKGTALEATAGYDAGGVVAGTADTLDVTAGFIKDAAGNAATTDAVADGAVTIS